MKVSNAQMLALALAGLSPIPLVGQTVPNSIPHQGRITVDNVNFDGTGQFKFALVADETLPGIQAAATANVNHDGGIESVLITDPGSGYGTTPSAKIAVDVSEGGTPAILECVVTDGQISAIQVLSPGSGYEDHDLPITIDSPTGTYIGKSVIWSNDGLTNGDPKGHVNVPVKKGLYAVQLGGEGMAPLPQLSGSNMRLKTWFNDGTNGWEKLEPDTLLTSVPYALLSERALRADAASIANGVPPGAITSDMIADGVITREKLGSQPSEAGETMVDPLATTLEVTFEQAFDTTPTVNLTHSPFEASNVTPNGFEIQLPRSIKYLLTDSYLYAVHTIVLTDQSIGLLYRNSSGSYFSRMIDATGLAWSTPMLIGIPAQMKQTIKLTMVDGHPAVIGSGTTSGTSIWSTWMVRSLDAQGSSWGVPQNLLLLDSNSAAFDVGEGATAFDRSTFSVGTHAVTLVNGMPCLALVASFNKKIPIVGGLGMTTAYLKYWYLLRATSALGDAWASPQQVAAEEGEFEPTSGLVDLNGKPVLRYNSDQLGASVVQIATSPSATSWGPPRPLPANGRLVVANGRLALLSTTGSGFHFTRSTTETAELWGPFTEVDTSTAIDLVFDGTGTHPRVQFLSFDAGDEVMTVEWIANDAGGTNWAETASPVPPNSYARGDNHFIWQGYHFTLSEWGEVQSGVQNLPSTVPWIAAVPGGQGIFGEGTLGGGSTHEVIMGSYNSQVANAALVIGNGTDGDNRSNALVVTNEGDLHIDGQAYKPGGGSFQQFSDARLKNIGEPFQPGLEALSKIEPLHYHYSADNPLGLPHRESYIGVIAQEVERALPNAVQYNAKGYRLVNNDVILWTMLNAIKELKGQNEALTKRLHQLEQTQ